MQILLNLRLRRFLSAGGGVLAPLGQLLLHGALGFPIRRAGLLQSAGFLEFFDGFNRRLAELSGAVAVVISEFLQVLLQTDDLRTGCAHAHFPADQPFPQDAVAADGIVIQPIGISLHDGGRRAENMVVALDGMHPIGAVAVLRHELDNADMVKAVILIPFDIDEVARLRDIRAVCHRHTVAEVKLPFFAAQSAADGHITPAFLIPHRAALAARLQGIVVAEHRNAVILVGEIDAPGHELRAPLAIGTSAPLAVFAVSALGCGIAQFVDGGGKQHVCAFIRQCARAQHHQHGEQQGCDVFHGNPPKKNSPFRLPQAVEGGLQLNCSANHWDMYT